MSFQRYLLREASQPATGDTVPFSTRPGAGRILIADSTGLSSLSFSAEWFQTDVAAAATDVKLTAIGTYPQFVVPIGWYADLHLMTMQTYDDGTDITSCAVRLWVNNQDVSSSAPPTYNYLALVPDNNGAVRGGVRLTTAGTAPYTVTTTSVSEAYFDPRVTTNGTAGTMNVLVRIFGVLYQVP